MNDTGSLLLRTLAEYGSRSCRGSLGVDGVFSLRGVVNGRFPFPLDLSCPSVGKGNSNFAKKLLKQLKLKRF